MSEDRQRGKSAIDAVHTDVSKEDEAKIGAKISEIYRVDSEEATEIHANYHAERIFTGLERRARENGMKREALLEEGAPCHTGSGIPGRHGPACRSRGN